MAAASTKKPEIAWALLPLGSLASHNFPQGYKRLLGDMPRDMIHITAVTQPAQLHKNGQKHGDRYEVVHLMQLEYWHLSPSEVTHTGRRHGE